MSSACYNDVAFGQGCLRRRRLGVPAHQLPLLALPGRPAQTTITVPKDAYSMDFVFT